MRSKGRNTGIGRIVAVAAIATMLFAFAPAAQSTSPYLERWQMRRATNHSRVNHDVRRVDLDAVLSDLARKHSVAMARRGSLFHTNDPASVYLKGKSWRYWGENVGVTGGSIDGLQKAFMASTSHRMNILNRSFRHMAIGTVRVDGLLWVTIFFWG